jgi:hypothetical protein
MLCSAYYLPEIDTLLRRCLILSMLVLLRRALMRFRRIKVLGFEVSYEET